MLITGNIDLSIGSVVGMSCMTAGTMMTEGVNPVFYLSRTVLLALLVGFVNGTLVAKMKLPSFIATLGTMTLARGLAQLVNNNHNTDFIGNDAQAFRDLFYYGEFAKLYSAVWIAVILWVVFNFLLSKTRTGRHIYAVERQSDAARLSGINEYRTILITCVISAFCLRHGPDPISASAGMGHHGAGGTYEMYTQWRHACIIGSSTLAAPAF